jgi:voltage-gated potassium channel
VDRIHVKRLVIAQFVFVCVLVVGTIVFHLMLGEGWVESFYRSVVTTTLTGLDSAPEGWDAQIFTIVLLLAGVAVFLYIAGAIVDLIAHGALSDVYLERKKKRAMAALENHVIICGYGRVGRRVAAELRATGTPYAVIDVNQESVDLAERDGGLVVLGDGTEDDDLEAAGLSRARGLVASADSDERNLFITLSARSVRPTLRIVARASNASSARKLELAGADRVVQPYTAAGLNMANSLLKPQVAAFLDIVSTAGDPMPDLRFEEILVTPSCEPCGRTLGDVQVQDATGALVIALRKADGTFDLTPGGDAVLEAGDILIGVGTANEIAALEALFEPVGAAT